MDWQYIALIILSIALLLASGYLRRLFKELHDLTGAISSALADDQITKEEIQQIFKEGKDVARLALDLYLLVARKKNC